MTDSSDDGALSNISGAFHIHPYPGAGQRFEGSFFVCFLCKNYDPFKLQI